MTTSFSALSRTHCELHLPAFFPAVRRGAVCAADAHDLGRRRVRPLELTGIGRPAQAFERPCRWRAWSVPALAIASITLVACARGRVEEFEATLVSIGPDGIERARHALHVTPRSLRLETDAPTGAHRLLMIVRRDLNALWVVNRATCCFAERPADDEVWNRALRRGWYAVHENLGSEHLRGFSCTRLRVEMASGILAPGERVEATVWVCDELPTPLRIRRGDGSTLELEDIRPIRQDERLFEVPRGCALVDDLVVVIEGCKTRARPAA